MVELCCDVAIVGAGPTGLVLANFLGARGIDVIQIERNNGTVKEPRAVSIDDESLRTIQAIGLSDEVLRDVALEYGSRYFTPSGVCFADVKPSIREYGFPRRNAFSQPLFEAALAGGLVRYPNVRALFEHACDAVSERPDGVELSLSTESSRVVVRARYVIGSDGARSMVRRSIGATLVGSTYRQRWLIVDLGATKELCRDTRVFCNPGRPGLTLPGSRGTRRYEFMLRDDEAEDVITSDNFIKKLLGAHGPDKDAPILRRQVYAFHARVADKWNTNRVFLAGDAAHLSPPFAGQGMNSGVRDAHNLAWKLAAVISGQCGSLLLNSYQQERKPHVWAFIQLAVNMGRIMMPGSALKAYLMQNALRAVRVIPSIGTYITEMRYKPRPFYQAGFMVPDECPQVVGRMLPQPDLESLDGRLIKLDELLGPGFALVAYGPRAQSIALEASALSWALDDLQIVAVQPTHYNIDRHIQGVPAGRDAHGYLSSLSSRGSGDKLLFIRPDRYIGAAVDVIDAADILRLHHLVSKLIAATHAGQRVSSGFVRNQAA